MPVTKHKRTDMPTSMIDLDFPEGITLGKKQVEEIISTLKHARTFITSREKMNPTGVKLYDELIKNLKAELE